MEFSADSELNIVRDKLRVLGEDISYTMNLVSKGDPQFAQKKFQIRQLHYELLPITEKYAGACGDYVRSTDSDALRKRLRLMHERIEKLRTKLNLQAV